MFRHVLVMTLTSSVGVMAVFLIDLLSIFYVSMAHRDSWQAAVSLMAKVMFFPFGLSMGMMIGIGTVVSVAVGRGDRDAARRLATSGLVLTGGLGLAVAIVGLPFRVAVLRFFGAEGEALDEAARLLAMVLPVNPLLAIGMGCASILRAYGDPVRAMYVTLAGALVTAVGDPLFIFALGQGVDGVGMAIVVSRVAFLAVGLWFTVHVHRIVTMPRLPLGRAEIREISAIAVPAIAANLALPFADWYVTRTIWQFGVAISAAAGIFDRLMPLVFSLVFALTTALGPIIGQNLGARDYARVSATFRCALILVAVYGSCMWLLIWSATPALAGAFGLSGVTGAFFSFLCHYATLGWVCGAFLLVANAVFNTLGHAQVSTLFNWGRATLGTMPFVWIGAHSGGPAYAMLGIVVAAFAFALAAVGVAWNYTRRLGRDAPVADAVMAKGGLA